MSQAQITAALARARPESFWLDVPDAPQDTEQLIEQGLAHRPDLLAAEEALHAAEAEV